MAMVQPKSQKLRLLITHLGLLISSQRLCSRC